MAMVSSQKVSAQAKPAGAPSRPVGGLELLVTTVTAIAVVAAIWAMSEVGGAVGITRADDWSYLLTQFEFRESGRFVMNNWAVTMLIGQTLLAAPIVVFFGTSIAALQAFVAVLSAAALVATYLVVRQVLSTGWSAFAVVTLTVSPVFGPSVVSFMTDVPSLLFLSMSLLIGMKAIRATHVHWYLLAVSAILAIVAFSFRDYAIIGFPAVIVVALVVHKSGRVRAALVGVLAGVAAIALGLYAWRHSLPDDLQLPGWDLAYSIQLVARGTLTIALLVSPALAAIAWWRMKGPSVTGTLVPYLTGLVFAVVFAVVAGFELLGNVVHPFGMTWLITGSGIRMWPLWLNRLIIVVAIASLALAVALALRLMMSRPGSRAWLSAQMTWTRVDPARAVIVVFPLLLLLAHSAATILFGAWYIDRYFILVIPFLAAALIRIGLDQGLIVRGMQILVPLAMLTVVAGLGIHVVDFNARFDGARWQMGRDLVDQGYAPHEIDAGIEWGGFHALDVGQSPDQREYRVDRNWWTERYPNQRVCVTVAAVETLPAESDTAGSDDRGETLAVSTLFGRHYYLIVRPGPDTCP